MSTVSPGHWNRVPYSLSQEKPSSGPNHAPDCQPQRVQLYFWGEHLGKWQQPLPDCQSNASMGEVGWKGPGHLYYFCNCLWLYYDFKIKSLKNESAKNNNKSLCDSQLPCLSSKNISDTYFTYRCYEKSDNTDVVPLVFTDQHPSALCDRSPFPFSCTVYLQCNHGRRRFPMCPHFMWSHYYAHITDKEAEPLRGNVTRSRSDSWGTSLVVQQLRLQDPNAGGPGLIPGQGTRSRILN